MKILSCHIENFGKLSGYSMNFRHGVNVICEENGWGKSTFAAFVRAMFYGLEGDRRRSLEENERKRYKPWQGGVFGGQLVFEIQGKAYQISRIFKDKEANDEFELRDAGTNLPSGDYTKRIGEEIFKINRESFMRTIFIGQNQCETSTTDDINARIGRLADNSNDLNNFESADGRLAEILNKLNPHRVSGSISKRGEEIARYERIAKGGEGISGSIGEYQRYLRAEEERHEQIKRQMTEAGQKQKEVSGQQSAMAVRSEWERLKKAVDRKMQEKEALRQKFPGDIPAMEAVKEMISRCGDVERLKERVSMYRLSGEEREELALLAHTFGGGVPTVMDVEEKINEAVKYRGLSQEYNSGQMSPIETQRLEELEGWFGEETESVTSVVSRWNNRNARKASLPSKQAALMALKASMESRRPQRSVFLIIGVVLLAAAGFTAVAVSPVAGAVFAAAGLAVILAGIVMGRKTGAQWPEGSPELGSLSRDIDEDEAFIAGTDEHVAAYLMAHGRFFDEEMVSVFLQEITAEAVEYSSLRKKCSSSPDGGTAAELESLGRSLEDFLNRYGAAAESQEFVDALYILKNKVEKYSILAEKQENLEKADQDYRALRGVIASFLKEHGYEPSDHLSLQLAHIRELADDYQDALGALGEAKKELEQFEAENDVSALEKLHTEGSLPTLEELNQTIQRLAGEREAVHNKISGYNNTLEALQEEYDRWEETVGELKELREQQELEQTMYRHVSLAKKKLEQAREAMTAKYAAPVLQQFGRYYGMISGREADNFHMDANTAVTVDELGKQRETNALSLGCRDLIGICLRTAFVDVMYQEEKPTLIMDDPFTNLDDKKVVAGREFVERLGEKYQIIYFTCSAARR